MSASSGRGGCHSPSQGALRIHTKEWGWTQGTGGGIRCSSWGSGGQSQEWFVPSKKLHHNEFVSMPRSKCKKGVSCWPGKEGTRGRRHPPRSQAQRRLTLFENEEDWMWKMGSILCHVNASEPRLGKGTWLALCFKSLPCPLPFLLLFSHPWISLLLPKEDGRKSSSRMTWQSWTDGSASKDCLVPLDRSLAHPLDSVHKSPALNTVFWTH